MKNVIKLFYGVLFVSLMLSCTKETEEKATVYQKGVLILNEGNYNDFNASVSWFSPDSNEFENDVFYNVNGRPLGNVGQNIATHNNLGFIVVNASSKLEIVDLENFQSTGTVEIFQPRSFLPLNNSEGLLTYRSYPGKVALVNTQAAMVTDSITVGNYPGKMLRHNDNVLVMNGEFGLDNSITVINAETLDSVTTVVVSDGTVEAVTDKNNNVWVLCSGKSIYDIVGETDAKLVQLDAIDYSVKKEFVLGIQGDYFNPTKMIIDKAGENIWYIENNGIYRHMVSAGELDEEPVIAGSFSAIALTSEGKLYATVNNGYTSTGEFQVYTSEGNMEKSYETGVAPNHIAIIE